MMRKRLRPMPDHDELAKLYAEPHDHTEWDDHVFRVDVTSAIAHGMTPRGGVVADLSCGNALIARRLKESHQVTLVLGDLAPGYRFHGPIEETIHNLGPRSVDTFICSETIEHLNDPDGVLKLIREKTSGRLVLSTPEGEDDDHNPEHVWGWDSEAVEDMLVKAGFEPLIHNVLDLRPSGCEYAFQIWACR